MTINDIIIFNICMNFKNTLIRLGLAAVKDVTCLAIDVDMWYLNNSKPNEKDLI